MDNLHVLGLHGEIDVSQKVRIERELDQIERFGPDAVTILDLADVRYLDTTFLNAILRVRARLAKTQPRHCIFLSAPRTSMVWRLLEIAKLDGAFLLFDDLASARRCGMIALHPALTTPAYNPPATARVGRLSGSTFEPVP